MRKKEKREVGNEEGSKEGRKKRQKEEKKEESGIHFDVLVNYLSH